MGLYLILMGVQGAGKGIQAGYMSDTYGIPHVSTGDLFRAMQTREDDLAKKVRGILESGGLVDDALTNEIVADRLAQADAANGVILDGYPRNQAQAQFLEDHLAEKGQVVSGVLLMKLDLFVAFKRAFGRVTDPETGASYNYYFMPGDVDFAIEKHPDDAYPPRMVAKLNGKLLKRRSDDADAMAVVRRIDTYLDNTQPLIDYYAAGGILHEVDAEQSIEAVRESIKALIDGMKTT